MSIYLNDTKNLIIRVSEYAIERGEFPLDQLEKDLELDDTEVQHIKYVLTCYDKRKSENPNHILVFTGQKPYPSDDGDGFTIKRTFTILPNAFYNYVDYLEIKEARKHANEAKKQSMLAIQLTIYAILISIILGISDLLLNVMTMIFNR